MKFFFLIAFSILISANAYVIWRLCNIAPANNYFRYILIAFVALAIISFFIVHVPGLTIPVGFASILYKLGTTWLIALLYLFITLIFMEVLRFIPPVKQIMSHNWHGIFIILALLSTVLLYGHINYLNKRRVEINLETGRLTEPLKIVGISDLHLGFGIRSKELSQWVELINRENPDVVLIAGDLLDNNPRSLDVKEIDSLLQKIKAKYGIYAVLGNHEYFGLPHSFRFIDETCINLLRDSVVLVDNRFYIVGRDDRSNIDRQSIEQLTNGIDKSKPVIMLDHQPYHLEETEANGIDFQFSGHTHSGQVWPGNLITKKIYELDHGLLKKGASHIFVSSGLGLWGGKFRIGTHSEYVVINLK